MNELATPTIEYAAKKSLEQQRRSTGRFLKTAQFCAVAPMVAGVNILVLYWLLEWEPLTIAGFWMLPLGGVVVTVGLVLAVIWAVRLRSMACITGAPMPWGKIVGLVSLLLSNFVVAVVCLFVGMTLATQPKLVVTLVNHSGHVIDSWKVRTDSGHFTRGPLAGEQTESHAMNHHHAKKVRVHYEQAGVSKDIDVEIPETISGSWGMVTVEVKPDLEATTNWSEDDC